MFGSELEPDTKIFGISDEDSGLILDFDADYGVVTNGSGAVVSWTDRKRGITCLAPNANTGRPTLVSVTPGVRAVNFNGTTQRLSWKGRIPELEKQNGITMIFMCAGGDGPSTLGSQSHYDNGAFYYQAANNWSLKALGLRFAAISDATYQWQAQMNNGATRSHISNNLSWGGQLCVLVSNFNSFDSAANGGGNITTQQQSINGGAKVPATNFTANMGLIGTFKMDSGEQGEFNIGAFSDTGGTITFRHGTIRRIQIYNKLYQVDGSFVRSVVKRMMSEAKLPACRELIWVGDSRTANANHPLTAGCAEQLQQLLGSAFFVQNLGRGGDTIANALAVQTDRVLSGVGTFAHQIYALWMGRNDLDAVTPATPATVLANLKTYCQNIKNAAPAGTIVVVFTELPSAFINNASYETDRQTLNTSIRAEVSPPWDYICDIGADASVGAAGQQNSAFFGGDHIHPSFSGDTVIAGLAYNIFKNL